MACKNYEELYEVYSNLIEKASKLLTFITIFSGGLLFLLKWLFDNYQNLGPNKGWVMFITAILLIGLVIELAAILFAMYVSQMEKVRLKPEDNEFFMKNEIDAIYFGIAERYTKTNAKNLKVIERKSRWLGYTQKGLFVLIFLIIFGVSLIFKLT